MKTIVVLASIFCSLVANAEVQFSKKKIQVGPVSVTVEIADTPEKTSHGLMYRQKLEEGTGMLFVFPDEEPRSFWMKNTFVPLSIGFFDSKKKLIDIQDMEPVKSEMQSDLPTYPSRGPAQYALEVPKGWFKKHKIKIGTKFTGY